MVKTFRACPLPSVVGVGVGVSALLSPPSPHPARWDLVFIGRTPCGPLRAGPPLLFALCSLPHPTQGFVLDIYYQGTEAEIQRCARPDGRVPLVRLLDPRWGLWRPSGMRQGVLAFPFRAELRSFLKILGQARTRS